MAFPSLLRSTRISYLGLSRRLFPSSNAALWQTISSRSWSSYSLEDHSLRIDALNTSFPYIWLRDSCQAEQCIHPAANQKLHNTSDIPLDIKPTAVNLEDDGIRVEWSDGHRSFFSSSFLERHTSPQKLSVFHNDVLPENWDKAKISASDNLFVTYESLKTPSGLLNAIDQLARYGLLFIRGVSNVETDYDKSELNKLASLFGNIRDTFYGRLWNVQNTNTDNIAYTNLKLGLHMDLLYFENPPRFQVLHCLRNRVLGGSSIFVDAFQAALQLKASNVADYNILTRIPVPFQYVFGDHHLHYDHPTIELEPVSVSPNSDPPIKCVNYGPPFQGPLLLSTPPEFYSALKKFDERLNDPNNTYEYTLQEQDAVIFDNRRVLHSRTAFYDIEGEVKAGEVNRWLQGTYFEGDTFQDRGRILRAKKAQRTS